MTIIKVFGKPVGEVVDGVFVKRVDGRVHFLKQPPAIAVDKRSLHDAMEAGARTVLIIDTYTGDEYRASCNYIINWGFELDRGWGEQIALPIKKWARSVKGQMGLFDGE